jgi:hypothetical protein
MSVPVHKRAMDELEVQIESYGLARRRVCCRDVRLVGYGTKHLNHMQQLLRLEWFRHVDDGA